MSKALLVLRLSSKGQIVIPAALRRKLGLKTGQPIAVGAGPRDELILRPVDKAVEDVDSMRRRLQRAARDLDRDLLSELHERRRAEREKEARERGG